jgi:transposase InsO family protein
MFIKNNSAWINIDKACELFKLTRSSYYEWIANYDKHLEKEKKYQELCKKVIELFHKYKCRYGSRRLADKLNSQGISCTKNNIGKIMTENKLFPHGYKKYKVTTTNSNHKYRVFDNLLARNFKVDRPNKAYVGDITYIRTDEGWLYLATVIDLYSRKLIGYKMSNRMTKDLVISALLNALKSRGSPEGVIVHSDRGSQYASNEYKRILKQHNLLGSMSKKGDCWDNAVAESFFASLKKEYVHHTHFKTRSMAQLGIFDYIEAWYNNERSHSTLNGLSPNEFEKINSYKFTNFSKKSRIKKVVKENIISLSMC